MLSNSTPLSGMSMFSASCIARDVSPIFHPVTRRPADRFNATRCAWISYASSIPISGNRRERSPIWLRVRSASKRSRGDGPACVGGEGHRASPITGLRSVPMPSASTSTMSPGCSQTGGSRRAPAPVGVPVTMWSPGTSVVNVEM